MFPPKRKERALDLAWVNIAAIIWFVIGLLLILAEFAMPGLIIIFFGAGAWIVSAGAYFKWVTSLQSQLLLFCIASILLLIVLRRWVRGKFYGHVSRDQDLNVNLDEFTGKEVLVLQDVIPHKQGGQVELKGATWNAASDELIQAGETATVVELDGLTLKIKKIKEDD